MPLGAGAIVGGVQALGGMLQGIIGSSRARRTQRELENLQTPTEQSNAAVNNLYAGANADPYSSSFYKMQQQNAGRATVNGLRGAQDRRGGLAIVGNLVRGQNDALLRAGATAEQQQQQRLAQATGFKVRDDQRLFDINKMMPYQKKFGLLAQKASGANQLANAGWKNLFGGLQTAAMGGVGGGGKSSGTPNYLSYGEGE
jgi:hypothetical protein